MNSARRKFAKEATAALLGASVNPGLYARNQEELGTAKANTPPTFPPFQNPLFRYTFLISLGRSYHLAGDALRKQKFYFRPDWEKVITPVIDYALTRLDVDPRRVAVLGISQGGYWVPRAAAFDKRSPQSSPIPESLTSRHRG